MKLLEKAFIKYRKCGYLISKIVPNLRQPKKAYRGKSL